VIFYILSIKHNTTYIDHIKHKGDASLEKKHGRSQLVLPQRVLTIHQTTQNHNPRWHQPYYLLSPEILTPHIFACNGQQITNHNRQYWKAW